MVPSYATLPTSVHSHRQLAAAALPLHVTNEQVWPDGQSYSIWHANLCVHLPVTCMYVWTGTRAVACMHSQATTTASVVCPSLSPSVKTAYTRKLLAHPHKPASKEFISSRYGIPLAAPRSLPTPVYRELEVETVATQPLTGPTVNSLVILTIAGSLCVGTVFAYTVVMPV